MKRFTMILALLVAALLTGCGGGATSDPVVRNAAAGTVTTMMPQNSVGMAIQKPATAFDGYQGGLSVVRDTRGAQGGTHGYVNSASLTHSIAGEGVVQFEWANLNILDNYAVAGENVATYSQANKFNRGPTWGAVSEANDTLGLGGALVSHEFDLFTTGPDDGNRIGLDIVVGDGRAVRGLGRSERAEATAAIRVGQATTMPWASWGTGIELNGNYRESAIKVVDSNGRVVFEVKPNGDIYRRGVLVP